MPASQLSTGLSLSIFSRETAEALQTFATFLGKGGEAVEAFRSFAAFRRGRTRGPRGVRRFRGRAAQAGARSRGEARRGSGRERRPGPPGRPGLLPVHQSDVENPRCSVRSSSCVRRSPGSPSFSPVDEGLGLFDKYLTGPAAQSALMLLCHCTPTDGAKILKRGMNPSSSCASVDEGGRALEREGGDGQERHPRGGNGAKRLPAPSRSTGFRFAPTGTGKRAGARRPAGLSASTTRTAIA